MIPLANIWSGPAQVDPLHPKAGWCKVAIVPTYGHALQNAANYGFAPTVGTSAFQYRAGRYGAGWEKTSTADEAIDFPSNIFTGATPRTVILGFDKGTSTDANYVSLGVATAGQKWSFRTLTNALRIEIEGSGYTSSLTVSSGYNVAACRYDGGALSGHTLFLNGKSEAATGANTVTTSATNFRVLGDPHGNGAITGANDLLYWLYMFDDALLDAEIYSIMNEPEQMLMQDEDLLFYSDTGSVALPQIIHHLKTQGIC